MRQMRFLIPILALVLLLTGCDFYVSPPVESTGYLVGFVGVPRTGAYSSLASLEENTGLIDVADLVFSTEPLAAADYLPLSDAVVEISGERTVITGTDGRFNAYGLRIGTKTIKVSHTALRTPFEKSVYISPGRNTFNFIGGIGHYLIIGIENYRYLGKSPGAAADAHAVADVFSYDSALAADTTRLINSQATKSRIKKAIEDIARRAGRQDYFVLYFTGKMGRDFLSPYDDNGNWGGAEIRDSELELWLSAFPGDVTVILDGAESATFADGDVWAQALKKWKYTVLASVRKDQEAYVHRDSGHAVFTHYLLEGLSGRRYPADRDGDGKITAGELYDYIENNMLYFFATEDVWQKPYLWPGYGDDPVIFRYR